MRLLASRMPGEGGVRQGPGAKPSLRNVPPGVIPRIHQGEFGHHDVRNRKGGQICLLRCFSPTVGYDVGTMFFIPELFKLISRRERSCGIGTYFPKCEPTGRRSFVLVSLEPPKALSRSFCMIHPRRHYRCRPRAWLSVLVLVCSV